MNDTWNILIVDDEPDIHETTRLALKRRKWRERGFTLVSAASKAEAIATVEKRLASTFHVAIIDVIMETDQAGLELCRFIRERCPKTLRIILRTGQPGIAPEEQVLNEYDIDQYVAKAEATPDKLYTLTRACLRSSLDISTLIELGKQLRGFTKALQHASFDDLLLSMAEGLRFLELKHGVHALFIHDLAELPPSKGKIAVAVADHALRAAHDKGLAMSTPCSTNVGLPANMFALPFLNGTIKGGVVFFMEKRELNDKLIGDLTADALLFLENWQVAYAAMLSRAKLTSTISALAAELRTSEQSARARELLAALESGL